MKINSEHQTFEVVEKIPSGYVVWNIGDNMVDGYLPICEELGGYKVNTATLKAIKVEDAELLKNLRDAAHYGVKDLKSAKRKLNKQNPKGYVTRRGKELAGKTIKFFEEMAQ